MSSSYQQTCTEISVNGNVLSATCKRCDGSLNKTSIVLNGIENIDGELKVTDPNKPSSFHQTCTEISINGDVLSATCKRRDGSLNKTSIVLNGIENIDGSLKYTSTIVAPAADNTIMKDKIKHVVVVMLENRGFDTVLGYLYEPKVDEPKHLISKPDDQKKFHGLSFLSHQEFQSLSNPLTKDGKTINQLPVKGVRATNSPGWDPGEPYEHVNIQLFSQKSPPTSEKNPHPTPTMNGFLLDYSTECKGDAEAIKQIMHMYRPADLPVLSSLAKSYAVSDMWFASVPSQTNTNRAFSICGTSMGLVDNDFLPPTLIGNIKSPFKLADDRFQTDTIWNVLVSKKNFHDWAIFWHESYPPLVSSTPYTRNLFPHLEKIKGIDSYFHKMEDEKEGFFVKAEKGTLPAFSYIEPSWGGEALGGYVSAMGNEYHCPADVTPGEHLLQRIYESLRSNEEAWKQTLLVILFDEHGGTYDHVPPLWGATPPWGDQPKDPLKPNDPPKPNDPGFKLQYDFKFDRFGVRVPAILVSPLIEEGTVFRSTTNTPYDHTSLLATILKWKEISPNEKNEKGEPVLGERVTKAPTFDQVLTRTEARTDRLFTPKSPSISTPLKFGDPFCLMHESGEYVLKTDPGIVDYYFPRVGSSKEECVNLDFRFGSGEVESGKTVQIRTDEYLEPRSSKDVTGFAGIRNFLGAWKDRTECYYYSTDDAKNYEQQYWTVTKVKGSPGSIICYGDTVQITNNYPEYKGQRLNKRKSLLSGEKWLSTALNAEDSWVIEPPVYQQTAAHKVTGEVAKVRG